MAESRRTKVIDLSIEIDAPAETVWKAITDAEELRRWFPLDARVEPGVGGTVMLSWGSDVGTATIDAWDEGSHLRYLEGSAEQGDIEPVAVDYTIETRGGVTVLRMVNSGFQPGDEWEDYIDTLDSGWRYFLWNLKHYLERHRGTPRRMVWDRRRIGVPKPQAWQRLFGAGGLAVGDSPWAQGAPLRLWSGDAGEVVMTASPIHLAGRFEGLNDAALFVELEPGNDIYSLGVWLSLYGVDDARADALQSSLGSAIERLFEPASSQA